MSQVLVEKTYGEYPSDEWVEQYRRTGYMGINILTPEEEAEYKKEVEAVIEVMKGPTYISPLAGGM